MNSNLLDFLPKQKNEIRLVFLCVKINNCVGEINLYTNSRAETNQKVNFPKVLISMQIIQFEVLTFNILKSSSSGSNSITATSITEKSIRAN